MRAVVLSAIAAAATGVALCAAPAAARSAERAVVPSTIQTVAAVPGMRFSVNGVPFEADRRGRAHPPPRLVGARGSLRALATRIAPGVRARFDRWYAGRRIAAVNLDYRVRLGLVDLNGNRVDPRMVTSVVLVGSDGGRRVITGGESAWLQGNRIVPESEGRESIALSYAAEKVMVAGSSVVHRGQQRFSPSESRQIQLRLLLFAARFEVRDALLGFPIGSAIRLEYPNGQVRREALGSGAELTLKSLPRGDYRLSVDAMGISSSRPVALSGDQDVALQVISWLDVAIVLLGLASIALALLHLRRPTRVAEPGASRPVAASSRGPGDGS